MTLPSPPPGEAPDLPALTVPWERVDRFVGQFIHDIRNGLNALELQLTLLAETVPEPGVREEVNGMRGGLLALSRELQAVRVAVGPVTLRPVLYPAGELLEDLRERLARRPGLGAAAAAAFAWEVDPAAAAAEVNVDPELIFDAMGRLFDNAVEFRESPASAIGLRALRDETHLILRLMEARSTPPPAEHLAAWGRTPLATTRRGAHAYGLGLFRVRGIVSAHGGELFARYVAAERRLETLVALPLVTPAP